MRNLSYALSIIGIFALFGALTTRLSILRQPHVQLIAGRPVRDARESKAATALIAAFGLSLVAALLAIFAWIF